MISGLTLRDRRPDHPTRPPTRPPHAAILATPSTVSTLSVSPRTTRFRRSWPRSRAWYCSLWVQKGGLDQRVTRNSVRACFYGHSENERFGPQNGIYRGFEFSGLRGGKSLLLVVEFTSCRFRRHFSIIPCQTVAFEDREEETEKTMYAQRAYHTARCAHFSTVLTRRGVGAMSVQRAILYTRCAYTGLRDQNVMVRPTIVHARCAYASPSIGEPWFMVNHGVLPLLSADARGAMVKQTVCAPSTHDSPPPTSRLARTYFQKCAQRVHDREQFTFSSLSLSLRAGAMCVRVLRAKARAPLDPQRAHRLAADGIGCRRPTSVRDGSCFCYDLSLLPLFLVAKRWSCARTTTVARSARLRLVARTPSKSVRVGTKKSTTFGNSLGKSTTRNGSMRGIVRGRMGLLSRGVPSDQSRPFTYMHAHASACVW